MGQRRCAPLHTEGPYTHALRQESTGIRPLRRGASLSLAHPTLPARPAMPVFVRATLLIEEKRTALFDMLGILVPVLADL